MLNNDCPNVCSWPDVERLILSTPRPFIGEDRPRMLGASLTACDPKRPFAPSGTRLAEIIPNGFWSESYDQEINEKSDLCGQVSIRSVQCEHAKLCWRVFGQYNSQPPCLDVRPY